MKKPNKDFENWAMDFSGMDGGNPQSDVWFCGIEYGGSIKNLDTMSFSRELDKDWISWSELDDLPYTDPKNGREPEDKITGADPFNLSIFKIISKLPARSDCNMLYTALFGKSGECFKMNLYPISFKSHSDELWSKAYYDKIGFLTKSQYKAWCMDYRFPALGGLVKKYAPKVLVCFGTTLKDEYSIAFSENEAEVFSQFEVKEISTESARRTIFHKLICGGATRLIVVPFPAKPSGLNSDVLLSVTADFIQEFLAK